jgi:hypothetical protein
MPELTKRGEEDRKREGEQMEGEPVKTGGDTPAAVTRDKGMAPATDNQGDRRSGEKQS